MRVTAERYRRFAVASLVALFVVIVAGAAVRLTDSGLGCDDWPNCNDTSFVDVSSRHAAIEQVNRLFNGIVTVAVLLVGALSHRVTPRRAGIIGLAWTLVALVAANAVLGGISVRVDLHPVAIQGHLLLALAAVVVNVILIALCSDRPSRPAVSSAVRGLVAAVAAGTAAAVVVGTLVTGAGPHAGDETAERLDLDIPSISRVHGVVVLVTIAIALALAARLGRHAGERAVVGDALSVWLFVGLVQAAIGYIQYLNDLPELLVGAHVAGATLLTMATTVLVLQVVPVQGRDQVTTPPRLLSVESNAT